MSGIGCGALLHLSPDLELHRSRRALRILHLNDLFGFRYDPRGRGAGRIRDFRQDISGGVDSAVPLVFDAEEIMLPTDVVAIHLDVDAEIRFGAAGGKRAAPIFSLGDNGLLLRKFLTGDLRPRNFDIRVGSVRS